ncbi:MAG TPA: hypothetical protein PK718_01830 [Candidatus Methanofastidiosa archaeon]|nr:hypothetical protein [Candidatus Methanofastidiosa archaeon]HPR41270.1 hypothetical protein [Candidatus Methanofastidiosa archaeon]
MPAMARKFTDESLLELYKNGMTDKEIADELGVSQSAVNYRREKLGLPSNYKKDMIPNDLVKDLNERGYTDKEIAERLGVSQSSVNYKRQRLGLTSNFKTGKLSDDLILTLYDEGHTDREIADELSVTAAAINYRREKLGLLSNSRQIDMEQFSNLFYADFPLEYIAHTMHISMSKALDAREELIWKRRPSHVYSKEEGI